MTGDRPSLPHLARAILHTLLDQHEQPGRQQVRRVRLSNKDHPDYFLPHDATPRQEVNAALQTLAHEGMITLRWRKWEDGNWLEGVDLVPEQANALSLLLRRTPRYEREQQLWDVLSEQMPRGEWHTIFLEWLRGQLAAHRSVAPLDLDDPQKNRDLLHLLDALATLEHLTMERTLSTRLFGDSKRLEELRPAILTVLRRHAPGASLYGNDDVALLRAHLLERIPEYIPLAGPLTLHAPATSNTVPGTLLDIRPFARGLALPGSTLREATIAECEAQLLITIENGTSFHEMLSVRPDAFLVVCTWGFASPSLIALLATIRQARPDLPFFHWGDLDPGGLRILHHLRSRLGKVGPLAMDGPTFEAHRPMARPLTKNDHAALTLLQEEEALADCAEVIRTLQEAGKKLEQESVAATDVVRACNADAKSG